METTDGDNLDTEALHRNLLHALNARSIFTYETNCSPEVNHLIRLTFFRDMEGAIKSGLYYLVGDMIFRVECDSPIRLFHCRILRVVAHEQSVEVSAAFSMEFEDGGVMDWGEQPPFEIPVSGLLSAVTK